MQYIDNNRDALCYNNHSVATYYVFLLSPSVQYLYQHSLIGHLSKLPGLGSNICMHHINTQVFISDVIAVSSGIMFNDAQLCYYSKYPIAIY